MILLRFFILAFLCLYLFPKDAKSGTYDCGQALDSPFTGAVTYSCSGDQHANGISFPGTLTPIALGAQYIVDRPLRVNSRVNIFNLSQNITSGNNIGVWLYNYGQYGHSQSSSAVIGTFTANTGPTGSQIYTSGFGAHGVLMQSNGGYLLDNNNIRSVVGSAWANGLRFDTYNAGNGQSGYIQTTGDRAVGIYLYSRGGDGSNGSGSKGFDSGGSGGAGGVGGHVFANNRFYIQTFGNASHGIAALSIGGDGGDGGGGGLSSGGGAGGQGAQARSATITNRNNVETYGASSHALMAQSLAGRGGSGGGGLFWNNGGLGGATSHGNLARVNNYSTVYAGGQGSYGIFAQSVGGFGGSGGDSYGFVGFGGGGNTAGNGGTVLINNYAPGNVTTIGNFSHAIFGQSIGGGGGSGGNGAGFVGIGGGGSSGGAGGGVGIYNEGTVTSYGNYAHGIFGQSIGGGGGDGGDSAGYAAIGGNGATTSNGGEVVITNTGNVHANAYGAHAIMAQSIGGGGGNGGSTASLGVGIGGAGGGGGNAGNVTVTNSGRLTTNQNNATALIAQSIGGGGGNGGDSFAAGGGALTIGGAGGSGGQAGRVSVFGNVSSHPNFDIRTYGSRSHGIMAQSIGGGGGNGGYAGSLGASVLGSFAMAFGGAGGNGGWGADTLVDTSNRIQTYGDSSHAIFAQSIGGGGGNGGYAIAASGATHFSASAAFGGSGGLGGGASTTHVISRGNLYTEGDRSSGIVAQSVGGGGGDGGFAVSGSVAGNASFNLAMGGKGGNGGSGGVIYVENHGAITTLGNNSHTILAQSIGGGGGNGGFAIGAGLSGTASLTAAIGGNGGAGGDSIPWLSNAPYYNNAVRVQNYGVLSSHGRDSNGILAQSIGGGGGNGGFSIAASGAGKMAANLTVGGKGATGGNGAKVDVDNFNTIIVRGDGSKGILAQSIGGGGGNGGFAIGLSGASQGSAGANLGGFGAGGGASGVVEVSNTGYILTLGKDGSAIVGQSIGGGGGNGGFSYGGTFSQYNASLNVGGGAAAGGNGNSVSISNSGFLDTYGEQAYGILAQSIGGGGGNGGFSAGTGFSTGFSGSLTVGGVTTVGGDASQVNVFNLDGGNIVTRGARASGILAQSIGGGGGNGGFAAAGGFSTGNAVTASVGGRGGGGGHASDVTVSNTANISTSGEGAYGIHAQSIGGGGGNGGFALGSSGARGHSGALSVGGSGGGGQNAGKAWVYHNAGNIMTSANNAHGLVAQSIGGGGGNGGFSLSGTVAGQNAISASIGGKGGAAGNSNGAYIAAEDAILTQGASSYGILAQALGGGGGNGGFSLSGAAALNANSIGVSIGGSGSSGGNVLSGVSVSSNADIYTVGNSSHAIVAQSIGGGGGNGGFSGTLNGTIKNGAKLGLALGGDGAVGGYANTVSVETTGNIRTDEMGAMGILAQSIGGGGGNGGFGFNAALSSGNGKMTGEVTLGGSGFGGGGSGQIDITNGANISTYGRYSYGVLAQSIGGGGGNGGSVYQGNISARSSGKQFNLALGGSGSAGGAANAISFTSTGSILTTGADAHGVLAQSIGGGGGNGGMAIGAALSGSESSNFEMKLGGNGGNGNSGARVTLTQNGFVETRGNRSIGLFGQSIGGGGGYGGMTGAVSLGLSGSNSAYSISLGGNGGNGSTGGNVSITSNGGIQTSGLNAHAMFGQSVGGGGGMGGDALAATRTGTSNRNVAYAVALGGNGGSGNHAGNVTLNNTNAIVTLKDNSYGLYAQAIGGGGGSGGDANAFTIIGTSTDGPGSDSKDKSRIISVGGSGGTSGDGGLITVTNAGTITTTGTDSHAIIAQSIGGGGGNGGGAEHSAPGLSDLIDLPSGPSLPNVPGFNFTPDIDILPDQEPLLNTDTKNLSATIGGSGGASGNGKAITINNTGIIRTLGAGSFGILAQSIGGGGGVGGLGASGETGTIGVGGAGGAAGNGGNVTINFGGDVFTEGVAAHGIFAQTIGGGGGIGGNVDRGITQDNTTGVAFNRNGGNGGNGGNIDIDMTGNIVTQGDGAFGIFAQSIGGGGGVVGSPTTDGVAFAGSTGAVGTGGTININHQGNIQTFGKNAHGIFAQSMDGAGAPSGAVNITYGGQISVFGEGANAIYANTKDGCGANCNINITLENGSVLTGGLNDATVVLSDGNQNNVLNDGVVQSLAGLNGTAFLGTAGNDNITNTHMVFGNLDLGSGINNFTNNLGATFVSGQNLNGVNTLVNNGLMNIGNSANILTSSLSGNLQQGADSQNIFDVDLNDFSSDKIVATGSADINGQYTLNFLNVGLVKPGERQTVLIDTASGITTNNAQLDFVKNLISKYELVQNSNQIILKSNVDFTPSDIKLNDNQGAVGDYFNSVLGGAPQQFSSVTEVISTLQTEDQIAEFYQQLTPESQASVKSTGILSANVFNQRLRSCHQYSGADKFIKEGECWWSAIGYRDTERDTTAAATGYDSKSYDVAGGFQKELDNNLHFGLGLSIERSMSESKNNLGKQDGEGYLLGAILKKQLNDGVFVTGTLAGGMTWYDASRIVQTGPATFAAALSDYRTGFVSAEADISKTYDHGNWYVRPLTGLNTTYAWSSAFNETGAGALNVMANRADDVSVNARAGIEFGGEIQDYVIDCMEDCPVMRPYVRISGVKYLTEENTKLEARFEGAAATNSFTVTSPTYQDFIDVQTGIEILSIDNKVLRLNYGAKIGEDSIQHSILAKFSIPFN